MENLKVLKFPGGGSRSQGFQKYLIYGAFLLLILVRAIPNKQCFFLIVGVIDQAGMKGDTFSLKTPKECSKKFAATLRGNSFPDL